MTNTNMSPRGVVSSARKGAKSLFDAARSRVETQNEESETLSPVTDEPMLNNFPVIGTWCAQRTNGYVSFFILISGGVGKEYRPREGDELSVTRWGINEDGILEIEVEGNYVHTFHPEHVDPFSLKGVDGAGEEYRAIPVRTVSQ
jgi:hypothetical protein